MNRIFIILILSLASFTSYGQSSSIPDSIRGMFIADSISETILKDGYLYKNFKKLKIKLKGKESVIIMDFDLQEFIAVIDNMGQFGIITNPHCNIAITKNQYNTIYSWYQKVSPYITKSMIKDFIKINYMAFCSDYEIKRMENLLSQYREYLKNIIQSKVSHPQKVDLK